MNITSFAKTKLGLILLSSTLSIALLIGSFEAYSNIQYYSWRKNFDNEGWIRRMTVRSSNPNLMWEYKPYGETEDIVQIKTNRYGFRDRDYESKEKPENTYRVAFIGDSVTLGWKVSENELFVRQFETGANQLGYQKKIQALNFSVDGYDTMQLYEMLRTKVLEFSPDKVVYMLCLNDFDSDNLSSSWKILYFKKPKSFLLTRLKNTFRNWRREDYHLYNFRENKKVVFQCMLDMSAMLKQKGISLQVVVVPVFFENIGSFTNYPLRDMHKEIDDFLKESGILYLDLLEAFTEQGKSPKFYAFDIWHPNPEGHMVIAQKLLTSIKCEGRSQGKP